jgi:hypothetical protein
VTSRRLTGCAKAPFVISVIRFYFLFLTFFMPTTTTTTIISTSSSANFYKRGASNADKNEIFGTVS